MFCVPKVYQEQVGLFDLEELDGMEVTLRVVDGFLMGTNDKGQLLVLSAPKPVAEESKEEIKPNGHANGHTDMNGLNGNGKDHN